MPAPAGLDFQASDANPMERPPSEQSRRLLNLSLFTTGTVLFALDLGCVLVAWPLALWAAYPALALHV